MKSRVLSLALALVLALLAGCGTGGDVSSSPDLSQPPATSASGEEPFVFTRDNLPRLDGSTSMVPLARSLCAVLLGEDPDQVDDLVQFSRTTQSYRNLMDGQADLLLAAAPAPEVAGELEADGSWLTTPFAADALVFVVNADNPVDNLTADQVRQIYTGEITNWSQVGGEDLDIVPFQRNPGAGSQTIFESVVMDDLAPMDPPSAWTADSMSGLLEAVREYDNSPAAIGYTVYYYANDMEMARGLKVLSIDGVAPSAGTIRSGEYPFLASYYVSVAKDAPADSPARILYDWVLGPDGQRLAEEMGYVPVSGEGAAA